MDLMPGLSIILQLNIRTTCSYLSPAARIQEAWVRFGFLIEVPDLRSRDRQVEDTPVSGFRIQ